MQNSTVSTQSIDAKHAELVAEVGLWIDRYGLFAGSSAAVARSKIQAQTAATFAYLCSAPNARTEAYQMAARFTAIFLYLDDGPTLLNMTNDRWREFHRELLRVVRGDERELTYHTAIAAWLEDLAEIGAHVRTTMQYFLAEFADYCEALDQERNCSPTAVSLSEFWEIRHRTIFVNPYILHWAVTSHISLPSEHVGVANEQLDTARTLIIYSNELGSLDRDRNREQTEINLALVLAREHSISVEAAADRVISDYNDLFRKLETAQQELRARYSHAKELMSFVNLVSKVVEGNIQTMLHLGSRYGGTSPLLHRLLRSSTADAPQ